MKRSCYVSWFAQTFGFEEEQSPRRHRPASFPSKKNVLSSYEYVREQFELEKNDTVLKSRANGRKFYIGPFGTPTLEELDRRLDLGESSRVDKSVTKSETLNYKDTSTGEDKDSRNDKSDDGASESLLQFEHLVGDVRKLHMDPQNEGAVFQAASQFNCLEMVSPRDTPEDGITRYEYDRTQGPICAMVCSAGTLYRNYFVNGFGQGGKEGAQLDCLDQMAEALGNDQFKFWTMKNGYMFPTRSNSMRKLGRHIRNLCDPNKRDEDAQSNDLSDREISESPRREELLGVLKVGVQWDTEVVTNAPPPPGEEDLMSHCVTQVYSSALPIAYDRTTTDVNDFEEFARIILDATYQAAFAVAAIKAVEASKNAEDDGISHKRVNLFLTKVGGGVFGNPHEWIIDSIKRSCEKYKKFPLNVYLVHYGKKDRSYVRGLKL